MNNGIVWFRFKSVGMKNIASFMILASLVGAAVHSLKKKPHSLTLGICEPSEAVPLSKRKQPQEAIPLPRREVIAGLPEKPPLYDLHFSSNDQRATMDIYRQLGVIDGEQALDFLMEKYGAGYPGLSYAMGYALSGWMENDLKVALAAFKGFLRVTDGFMPANFKDPYLFSWKGKDFHSGLL